MLYALSFVLVHLLHWTVATKRPAMTALALATRLRDITRSVTRDDGLDGFVDEVAHPSAHRRWPASSAMWRPWCPWCCWPRAWGTGCGAARPSAPPRRTTCCICSTCLGPTLLFAAFTGVLLFVSSLIAGWVENWFVFQRLDSAIAWNPRIVAVLGQARAQRQPPGGGPISRA